MSEDQRPVGPPAPRSDRVTAAMDRMLAEGASDFRAAFERLVGSDDRPVASTDRRAALAALDDAIAPIYGERRGGESRLADLISDETSRLWTRAFEREGQRLTELLDRRDMALASSADPDIALLTASEPYTIRRRAAAARAFDDTRRWVDPNGYRLDARVWNARGDVRRTIDNRLRAAIFAGTDARTVARDLERFLTPEALRGRREGRQTVGNGSHVARRLARTEITRALGQSTVRAARMNPMVRGIRWRLSGSHPRQDVCDQYASADSGLGPGVYPTDRVPTFPPHPYCLCVLVPSVPSREEAINEIRRKYRLDVSDEEFALRESLTTRLEGLTRGSPVRVEGADNEMYRAWPNRPSDTIDITPGKRKHYVDRHSEMDRNHRFVVDTLRDPDEVRRDRKYESRALLYRRISGEAWVLVVVEFPVRNRRANLLITAHVLSDRKVRARAGSEPVVWTRGG